tara:strand:- start:246 stop:1022 length:777 start_codon:yes stop_codon:yes gene_type:complete
MNQGLNHKEWSFAIIIKSVFDETLKALLLAAGHGVRLRPITLQMPKCLVNIGGQPIIYHWIKELERVNCEEILINLHAHSSQVTTYLQSLRESLQISTCYEPELLGTALTLIHNKDYFGKEDGILIHADNMMEEGLDVLLKAHSTRPKNCILTMLTFTTSDPSSCGIVKTNKNGIMIDFTEKPKGTSFGNMANAAVYIFDSRLFDEISNIKTEIKDFSKDVLPNLLGKVFTCHTDKLLIDIGTPKNLAYAQQQWGKNA